MLLLQTRGKERRNDGLNLCQTIIRGASGRGGNLFDLGPLRSRGVLLAVEGRAARRPRRLRHCRRTGGNNSFLFIWSLFLVDLGIGRVGLAIGDSRIGFLRTWFFIFFFFRLSWFGSFKKSGNGQGGQSRTGPTNLSSESNFAVATTRARQNGAHVHSQLHGKEFVICSWIFSSKKNKSFFFPLNFDFQIDRCEFYCCVVFVIVIIFNVLQKHRCRVLAS